MDEGKLLFGNGELLFSRLKLTDMIKKKKKVIIFSIKK
jgi:hypothetical protein